jgi:hypothetical protein
VRIGHFAPFDEDIDDATVDICTDDDTILVSDLTYKEVTDYLSLTAGDYDLKLAEAEDDDDDDCEEVLLNLPSIRLSDGEIVELFAIGDDDNQPLQIVSTTGYSLSPGDGKAEITIVVNAAPDSRRNFRFDGDLGDFKLDDASRDEEDDEDAGKSFEVSPGVYNVGELVPHRWLLVNILCQGGNTLVNLAGEFVAITAAAGDDITCTFVNERDTTVRVRVYNDANENGERDRRERGLPGWTITLYNAAGEVASGVTNIHGKVNFRYLPAGEYTVCQTQTDGWTNTQPGALDPNFDNQPCYTFESEPAEFVYLFFGNREGDAAASATRGSGGAFARGIIRVADPYEDADDANYEAPANDIDADLNQADDPLLDQVQSGGIFLPLIRR